MRSSYIVLAFACVTGDVAVALTQPGPLFWTPRRLGMSGRDIALLGDVNHDGHADLAIGAPDIGNGDVRIHSGADGMLLYSVGTGDTSFGFALDAAGDVNADGTEDFVVGAPRTFLGQGAAYVISGLDGAALLSLRGPLPGAGFGAEVAGVGDVNADGFDDVAITSITGILFGSSSTVEVISGIDGATLYRFDDSSRSSFGEALGGGGDVDRDGFDDFVIGANGAFSGAGSVTVFSGRTGAIIHRAIGSAGEFLGTTIAIVGDVDADGHDDFIGGSMHASTPTTEGVVRLFSGATGSLIREHRGTPGLALGERVSTAGDVNGDGYADYAATANTLAVVYSGVDGSTIHTFVNGPGFGTSLHGGRDVDGDGFDDIAVGGSALPVFVYTLGASGTPGRERIIGAGCRSSNGFAPRIDWRGSADLDTTLDVLLRGARPNLAAVLHIGDPATVALDGIGMPSCTLLAIPLATAGASISAVGTASSNLTLPSSIAPVGFVLQLQWVIWDPGANALGVTSSDALELTIGRRP